MSARGHTSGSVLASISKTRAVNPSLEAPRRHPCLRRFREPIPRYDLAPALPRSRQRGVALITAVLIVALATILATQIGFESALEQRRSIGILLLDQAFQVGLGAEAWAASYLKDDAEKTQVDHRAERWATPIPPIPIDGGQIEGEVEDLDGRFNLNNVLDPLTGEQNLEGIRRLRNLLTIVDLEPQWANVIADWLDGDTTESPDGGEDSLYLSQTPPYRPPNTPITSASELLALSEFGLERYQKLRPYVTALPVGSFINVCTAPGAVLDALNDGTLQYSVDLESLAKSRENGCFPTPGDFLVGIPANLKTLVENDVRDQSHYFAVRAFVTLGTTEFSLYSLLHRDRGVVRPVMRTFGPE